MDTESSTADERGPTEERLRHADFYIGDIGTVTVAQSPIERLLKRNQISQAQAEAARKLYSHWYYGGLSGGLMSGNWLRDGDRTSGAPGLRASEYRAFHCGRFIDSLQLIRTKMDAAGLPGADAAIVLEDVVCHEVTPTQAAMKVGHKHKAAQTMGMAYLCGSLNILIQEWGI